MPKANVLGEVGKGYKTAIETLNEGRIGIGAQMIGLAQGALEHAIAYTKERKQFGKPIAEFQAVQHQLARAAMDVEAARLTVYNAARLRDAGRPFLTEAAICKIFSSEVAERVASLAVNLFGGNGFVKDYPVEKLYRDAKIGQIYEGTSNLQLQTIAKQIWARRSFTARASRDRSDWSCWRGVATWLVHRETLHYGFEYDDYYFLRPHTLAEVLAAFHGPWDLGGVMVKFYRPLTVVLHAVRFELFGLNAPAHHAVSLTLFAVAASLDGLVRVSLDRARDRGGRSRRCWSSPIRPCRTRSSRGSPIRCTCSQTLVVLLCASCGGTACGRGRWSGGCRSSSSPPRRSWSRKTA